MRLDKYLSQRTEFSRSRIKDLIAEKKVMVNDIAAVKANMNVSEADNITIAGNAVRQEKFITLIMNKPAGYISATEDRSEKTVIDLLPPEYSGQKLSPVGRLDKDTTGMLLLTNDGELLHKLTSPKKHVMKYYIAHLSREFTSEAARLLENGIALKDGSICKPSKAAALDEKRQTILIAISEGKYHQVKRMLAAAGNHVEKLHRTAIGGLVIPEDLLPGESRVLSDKDLCKVLKTNDIFSLLINMLRKNSS